jgi:hypothetical protein
MSIRVVENDASNCRGCAESVRVVCAHAAKKPVLDRAGMVHGTLTVATARG